MHPTHANIFQTSSTEQRDTTTAELTKAAQLLEEAADKLVAAANALGRATPDGHAQRTATSKMCHYKGQAMELRSRSEFIRYAITVPGIENKI